MFFYGGHGPEHARKGLLAGHFDRAVVEVPR